MRIRGLSLLVLLAGCGTSEPPAGGEHPAARAPARSTERLISPDGGVEFITEQFEDLYPTLLVRRSMPLGERAALWNRKYFGRWVRWSGTIRSFTPNGITLRRLPSTSTFDVSLKLDEAERSNETLRKRFSRGDRVVYIGRLESYDDIFRTLYLSHGAILHLEQDTPINSAP